MKFEIESAELETILKAAAAPVAKSISLPILSSVLLRATSEVLSLSTTNLEQSMVITTKKANIQTPGSAALPARRLLEVVKSQTGLLKFCSVPKKKAMTIKVNGAVYVIQGMDVEEFPDVPREEVQTAEFPAGIFAKTLADLLPAASRDATRYILNSIAIEPDKKECRFIATDGRRLMLNAFEHKGDAPGKTVVPLATAEILSRLIRADSEDALTVGLGSKLLRFDWTQDDIAYALTSRQVEGVYPNYKQVLPSEVGSTLTVVAEELRRVIRQALVMAIGETPLKLICTVKSIEIMTETPDIGSVRISLPSGILKGKEVSTAFNGTFMLDALDAVAAEKVNINCIDPLSPVEICDGHFRAIIMPMNVGL